MPNQSSPKYSLLIQAVATAGILMLIQVPAGHAQDQSGNPTTTSSITTSKESAHLAADHHYQSPAGRANDALLITEVKVALANDGMFTDHPVVVDCDHGKILLSGIVNSAQDAQHAAKLAAREPGVAGVNNQLTWR
ncbi:MAG: BON domain-containing protein [Candidatus Binataceae bacterium]|nr:BON domain-containing protein [Candidatus Binataceae bacterium]